MGLGSYFLMINASPWTLSKIQGSSRQYQMNTWSWPDTFVSGTATRVYIESEAGPFGQDDGAEINYHVGRGSGSNFQIAYHDHKDADPTITTDWQSFGTLNHPIGTTTRLRWGHDNNSPFFISSRKTSTDPAASLIVSNDPPVNWMQSIYSQISCLSLRELTMPGSHDAGMSKLDGGAGGTPVNTLTQRLDIAGQLKYGSRYFDIRPVLASGRWKTGHYSFSDLLGAWVGGNGQDMRSIIDQVNAFTANKKELVILYMTHGYDTDHWTNEKDAGLTQAQWDELLTGLTNPTSGIKNRLTGVGGVKDVTLYRLNQLTTNSATVIIVVDENTKSGQKVSTLRFADQGIFNGAQFPKSESYSNTNDQEKMANDQLVKMKAQRTTPTSNMSVLSWTLTQGITTSIIDNAENVNQALPELLWPATSTNTYPNILYVDAYPDNGDVAALAMAINLYHARIC
ncbi:PLC-like phosphodiesterase [Setomelanomma holmii]|uniref:PLC-like phosphodiesterase n=1 Tax=Setomelanomma holmii TaxID=210430 RepID=A0A9P4GW83_9PLEO|nr:PLC-like phosphodiesterase [Setomelanomma holmii]